MHRVSAGVDGAGDQNDVADLQRTHLLVRHRCAQRHFATGALEASLVGHRGDRRRRVSVEPLRDLAAASVDDHAKAAKRPAIVRNRHEKAGGNPIEHPDLAPDQRRAAAKPHRSNA